MRQNTFFSLMRKYLKKLFIIAHTETIKIDNDRSLDVVKIAAIADGKDYYRSGGLSSTALYVRVKCPMDADAETKNSAIHRSRLPEFGAEIGKQSGGGGVINS